MKFRNSYILFERNFVEYVSIVNRKVQHVEKEFLIPFQSFTNSINGI